MSKPYVIGVCGASCSGKTTTVEALEEKIRNIGESVTILSQDRYYNKKGSANTNFDKPKALEWDLMEKDLKDLISGKEIDAPIYNFSSHSREEGTDKIKPSKVIIVEGILIFTQKRILDLIDLKVFVSSFNELCFARRVERDVRDRGRDIEEVTDRYCKHVFPSVRKYVEPSQKHADIILQNNIKGKFIGLQILLDHIIAVLNPCL